MQRLRINVEDAVWQGLVQMGEDQHRPLHDQIVFILVKELERRGYLPSSGHNEEPGFLVVLNQAAPVGGGDE